MFLYNILTGGSSKQQTINFDKISFKINLADNIPQYYQFKSNPQTSGRSTYQQEQQVTQSHPLYNKIVDFHNNNQTSSTDEDSTTKKKQIINPQSHKLTQMDKKIQQYVENKNQRKLSSQIVQRKEKKRKLSLSVSSKSRQQQQKKSSSKNGSQKQVKQQALQQPQNIIVDQSQKQFTTPQPKKPTYQQYTTTQNDTLFGLALKLDIHQQQIKQLNNINQHLYPGMTIKLPKYCDISKLYDQPQEQQLSKVKISQLLSFESTANNSLGNSQASNNGQVAVNQTQKFDAQYYAGLAGYIKGTLSINKNYIIFNPDLQNQKNLQHFNVQKLLKFNAIVETIDIQDIEFIEIPEMYEGDSESKIQNPEKNQIIQIFLYIVGNSKIEKKYKERLNKLKTQKKAIASISFSLRGYKSEAKQKCGKIIEKVKNILRILEQQENHGMGQSKKCLLHKKSLKQQKRLTNIPFFDIIHENIHPKIKQQMQSIVISPQKTLQNPKYQYEKLSPSLSCGILTEASQIINDTMFHILQTSLPLLYQQCNWTKIYSSTTNGTSFITFLNKSKNQYPLILLVKQYKGWKFGAYICQSLQTGKTGRGEMFIFTFRNESDVPEVYKWTGKNQFFVYIQKDEGIGIGMGTKYGIFLKSNFEKGSSAPTFTFGNKQGLSKKQDFTIDQIQLWAIDNNY